MNTAIRQFLPAGIAGAIAAIVILLRAPEVAWVLPGLWQLLVSVGLCASLASLPRQMVWAAGWYFLAGALSLTTASGGDFGPWTMGLPFGLGQLLVAGLLHLAGREEQHD